MHELTSDWITMNDARKLLRVSANGLRYIIKSWGMTVIEPKDAKWKRKYLLLSEIKQIKKSKRGRQQKPSTCITKHIDKHGYVNMYRPTHPLSRITGYVYEHTLVMEKHLGRYLTSKEAIHHRDGDRQNNSIENLMIFPTKGDHLKFGHKANLLLKNFIYKIELAQNKKQFESSLNELNNELRWMYGRKTSLI